MSDSGLPLEPTMAFPRPTTDQVRNPSFEQPDRLLHWLFLLLSLAVLLAAAILQIRGTREVVIPLGDFALPGTCTFRTWAGMDCPGCGLTRCFVSLAHGDLRGAWHYNPAGIFLFSLVVFQLPYRSLQLWRIRQGRPEFRLYRTTNAILLLLVVLMVAQWLFRMILTR